ASNADLLMGSLFRTTRSHITLDAPMLQSSRAPTLQTGKRATGIQASIGGEGPFTYETRNFFNYSAQVSRRVSENTSALSADDELLRTLGFAPDSVRQAASILRANGLSKFSQDRSVRLNDAATFIARVDHAPVDRNTLSQ